jgi:two-component system, LuxR family, response regulator FixJ
MADTPLVHVVDDDEAVRDSLSVLLESAGLSVRTYDSATAFLDALPRLGAGCVLTGAPATPDRARHSPAGDRHDRAW